MTNYYQKCLRNGKKYEKHLKPYLESILGFKLNFNEGRKEQLDGETEEGVEIKCQMDKLKKYGNLYIEIDEKSDAAHDEFYPSGIFREDNTWLWVTGDYDVFYIFEKSVLIDAYDSGKFRMVAGHDGKGNVTSHGFLLPLKEADKIKARKYVVEE